MSYFAKVLQGKVLQVIVAEPEFFNIFVDTTPGDWIETSFGARGNVHYDQDGVPDGKPVIRANYAAIGGTYDQTHDVFYDPQPFPSWVLNTTSWIWEAPIPYPENGGIYNWDEDNQTWVKVPDVVDS